MIFLLSVSSHPFKNAVIVDAVVQTSADGAIGTGDKHYRAHIQMGLRVPSISRSDPDIPITEKADVFRS